MPCRDAPGTEPGTFGMADENSKRTSIVSPCFNCYLIRTSPELVNKIMLPTKSLSFRISRNVSGLIGYALH